jgi:Fe-S-cluster containining protein
LWRLLRLLSGRFIGAQVSCGIYEWRPSPCRELEAGSAACLRARQRHGLAASP